MSREVDTVILGAGLTGLSAAHHLRGHDFLLLEKEDRVGGLASTECIDEFYFDLGSHVWFTSDKEVDALVKALPGVSMRTHKRSAWVHIYDRLIPAPFQGNLFGLPLDVVSECLVEYVKAIENDQDQIDNFGHWLRARFGEGFYRHFMYPYNSKVWTVPPEELSIDWQNGRVDVPAPSDLIDGAIGLKQNALGPNAEFHYPEYGGTEAIVTGFSSRCDSIECGARISRLDVDSKTVYLSDGRSIRYDSLISTIPLYSLVSLLTVIPQNLQDAAGNLRCTKVLLVNIGLKTKPEHQYHWIYFSEPKYPFFRISFPCNYADSMCPKGTGSIQAECAFPMKANVDEDQVAGETVTQLINTGYLDVSQVEFVRTHLIDPAYVIYDHARTASRQTLIAYLSSKGVYCGGRFGGWEYLNMDGCIVMGMEAANWALSAASTRQCVKS